jgi:hypothetical protein
LATRVCQRMRPPMKPLKKSHCSEISHRPSLS